MHLSAGYEKESLLGRGACAVGASQIRTLESWFVLGKSSPAMAQECRLVKYSNYSNLPRSDEVLGFIGDDLQKNLRFFPSNIGDISDLHSCFPRLIQWCLQSVSNKVSLTGVPMYQSGQLELSLVEATERWGPVRCRSLSWSNLCVGLWPDFLSFTHQFPFQNKISSFSAKQKSHVSWIETCWTRNIEHKDPLCYFNHTLHVFLREWMTILGITSHWN